ncbi:MAG: ABC transporter ATP-binding protein/permease [Christensenellaceae bacterium]|jgi:ATP-binding cassette subfamily B protein|nr:ABC transporter ATP-binding protein/permease [Christensenellaceae bacterium]
MIKKFASQIKQYKTQAILAPLTIIIEVFLEVAIPFTIGGIIDDGLKNIKFALIYGGVALLMAMLSLLAGGISGLCAAKAGTGFAANLRNALFSKIQDFSSKNIDKFNTGSLVTRLTLDINYIQMAFTMIIRIGVRAPIMFISALIMSIVLNAKLALVFISVIPFIVLGVVLLGRLAFPRFKKLFDAYDQMENRIQENLIGIRVVKSFAREDHETKEFSKLSKLVFNVTKHAEKVLVFAMPIMQFIMYLTSVLIIFFGGNMMIRGELSDGDFTTFIQYIGMILMSLMMIAMIFVTVIMNRTAMVRACEILDEKPDISDENADLTLTLQDGSIEFENVSFRYGTSQSKLILEDFNLTIKSGETIGIIGGTGSGKTTLVQLIPRLYDTNSGTVKAGGNDVRNYSLFNLRNEIAFVPQKNLLFSGTIKDNLLWGNPDATDEELQLAAKRAAAHNFIMSFPDGYNSAIEQGGVNVSGGQKQRLCIARALLKKPKIMVFDDSTSAVDVTTDAEIRSSIKENLSDMTVIIIAQRISSLSSADRIIVMSDGKIDGIGTHDELLENNMIYKEVYCSQLAGSSESETQI